MDLGEPTLETPGAPPARSWPIYSVEPLFYLGKPPSNPRQPRSIYQIDRWGRIAPRARERRAKGQPCKFYTPELSGPPGSPRGKTMARADGQRPAVRTAP